KLATMLRTGGERTPLFDNDRPVLLYNPHFDRTLGSFERFGRRLIDFVRDDGRYNLVVAPHLRMGQDRGSDWCRLWESLSIPGRIIVATGSGRLTDMSYALGCGLYIGDVSSQGYEFLIR